MQFNAVDNLFFKQIKWANLVLKWLVRDRQNQEDAEWVCEARLEQTGSWGRVGIGQREAKCRCSNLCEPFNSCSLSNGIKSSITMT